MEGKFVDRMEGMWTLLVGATAQHSISRPSMELLARLCDYVCLLHFLCARPIPLTKHQQSQMGQIVIFGINVTTPCDATMQVILLQQFPPKTSSKVI